MFSCVILYVFMTLTKDAQVRIPAAPEESEEDAERTGLVQDLKDVQERYMTCL